VRRLHLAALVAVAGTLAVVTAAVAGGGDNIRERLRGFEEVPVVLTPATGEFKASVRDGQIDYVLSYSGLRGNVTQAHIHIGQELVNGGISVWLCETATNPSPVATTPQCPQSGTVTGTLTAEDVIGPDAQGVAARDFATLLRAIRAGLTYANVHSSKSPGGEIRAQLESGQEGDDD